MNQRYIRLYTLPDNLYLDGSPVLISKAVLLKDNRTGSVLAQLKLQNLFRAPLVACKVHIRTYDPSGIELKGVDSYSYSELSVRQGEFFGSRDAIFLPDNITRKISISVISVVFLGGTIWEHEPAEWTQLGLKWRRIEVLFPEYELQKQYSIEVGDKYAIKYAPETLGSLTLCTCGALNFIDYKRCYNCNRDLAVVQSATELDILTKKKEARLIREKAEQVRCKKEEEQRIAIEKAKKKMSAVIATIAVVSVIIVWVIMRLEIF